MLASNAFAVIDCAFRSAAFTAAHAKFATCASKKSQVERGDGGFWYSLAKAQTKQRTGAKKPIGLALACAELMK